MREHKKYKQEAVHFIVKWLEYDTIKFRAFKRDKPACDFVDFLSDVEGIPPEDIRITMQ